VFARTNLQLVLPGSNSCVELCSTVTHYTGEQRFIDTASKFRNSRPGLKLQEIISVVAKIKEKKKVQAPKLSPKC